MTEERFKKIGNYIFDKYIFQATLLIIILILILILFKNNFNLNYVYCNVTDSNMLKPNNLIKINVMYNLDSNITSMKIIKDVNFKDGMCKNPAYKKITWENQEYLPPGRYGEEHLEYFNFFYISTSILLIFAIIINTILYNIGKKK